MVVLLVISFFFVYRTHKHFFFLNDVPFQSSLGDGCQDLDRSDDSIALWAELGKLGSISDAECMRLCM